MWNEVWKIGVKKQKLLNISQNFTELQAETGNKKINKIL